MKIPASSSRTAPVRLSAAARAGGLLQRCGCGKAGGGECAECRRRRLQRRGASPASGPERVPPEVEGVLRSPGRPLDAETRAWVEPRFGHHFGHVRVHTDARAAESARAVDAEAYTVGRDVVFGAGAYQPRSSAGRRLIAHELAHVVQQRGASATGGISMEPSPRLEAEASRAADAAITAPPGQQAVVAAGAEGASLRRFSSSPGSSSSSPSSSGSSSGSSDSSGSSGSGGGDGGTPAGGTSCRVDVRATKIGATAPLPIYHLFIIYVDGAGTEWYFRGGPGQRCGTHPAPYYGIECHSGRYLPGTVDWDPSAPSTTVLSGSAACGKDTCLSSEVSRINGLCTGYAPLGPNSNTVVSTMLNSCGIPRRKPVSIAPGWGSPYL